MFELLSIPAILALVEAVKQVGLPSKYAAVVAIACGAVFGFILGEVVTGVVLGLAASGVYSGAKAMLEVK